MIKRSLFRLLSALASIAAVFALCGGPRPASGVGIIHGRIAFSSDRSGQFEIYTMLPNGYDLRRITPGREPTWSPDNNQIAFTNAEDIFIVNADGTGLRNVTKSPYITEESPSWSADGTKIAFSAYSSSSAGQIYVVDLMSRSRFPQIQQITNITGWARWPAWSPDGTRIAFSSPAVNLDQQIHTCVMNADGSNPQYVNFVSGMQCRNPAWSGDSQYLVYPSSGYNGIRWVNEMIVVRADGSKPYVSHEWRSNMWPQPTWVPDTWAILTDEDDGAWPPEIRSMDASGGPMANLTNNPAIDFQPAYTR